MVNTINVSIYSGLPPTNFLGEGRHYIQDGPIYCLKDLKRLVDTGEDSLRLWTKGCIRDVKNLFSQEMDGVLELLSIIAVGDAAYLKSEWCVQKPAGPWAACDSYRINRNEWIQTAHKYFSMEYYVKFAIGKTGKLLLVVSCHLSN